MKSRTLVALLSALTITSAVAEELTFGIGASVNDGVKIYLPINMGELIIEPTVSTFDRDEKLSGSNIHTNDYRSIEIGLGIFKNKQLSDNTHMYYGGRFGYIDSNNSSSYGYTTSSYSYDSSTSSERDGYFIAPTLGMQYFITQRISLGLDTSFTYSKLKGTTVSQTSSTDSPSTTTSSDAETSTQGTSADIILRYMFN